MKKQKIIPEQYKREWNKKVTPISSRALWICLIGDVQERLSRYKKAISYYRRAFKYEYKHYGEYCGENRGEGYYGKAKNSEAICLDKMNRIEEAESIYQELINTDFKDSGNRYIKANAINNYAIDLIKSGKYEDSFSVINDYIKKHRRCDGILYRIRSIAEYYMDEYVSALKDMNNAIKCHIFEEKEGEEFLPKEFLFLGIIRFRMGLIKEAQEDFVKAFNEDSKHDGARGTRQLSWIFSMRCKKGLLITDWEIEQIFLGRPGQKVYLEVFHT